MSLIRRVKVILFQSGNLQDGKALTLILSVNSDRLKKLCPRSASGCFGVASKSLKACCTRARCFSVRSFIVD